MARAMVLGDSEQWLEERLESLGLRYESVPAGVDSGGGSGSECLDSSGERGLEPPTRLVGMHMALPREEAPKRLSQRVVRSSQEQRRWQERHCCLATGRVTTFTSLWKHRRA